MAEEAQVPRPSKSDIEFNALRNATYNSWRKAYLDIWNRFFSFVIIVGGAAAVADFSLGLGFKHGSLIAGLIVTITGALQLLLNYGERARIHEFSQRRYFELLERMAKKPDFDQSDIADWSGEVYRIYADEPAPYRALDAMAYNFVAGSMGSASRRKVNLWQRMLCQRCRFDNSKFPEQQKAGWWRRLCTAPHQTAIHKSETGGPPAPGE